MSNNVAEYSAFCAVARECMKYTGLIHIRGDSKLVIMQLGGKWKINGGLYMPFHQEAKALWSKIKDRARLEWIPRDENDICDVLSKQVLKDRGVVFRIQPEREQVAI
jgi:probable phosphoglycerate mutase